MLGGMADGSEGRRDPEVGSGPAVVACIGVRSRTPRGARTLRQERLWGLALRRVERCLRPGDWMCPVGAGRIAVCFGGGAHHVAPGALGARLAQALGDHLSVGTSHLDLHVAVGVATGSSGIAASSLTLEAFAAIRSRTLEADGPTPAVVLSSMAARSTTSPIAVTRRHLHPVLSVVGGSGAPGATAPAALPRSDIAMLIVGPPPAPGDQHSAAVEGVLAVTSRLGITPESMGTSDPASVLARYRERMSDVVVIPLRRPGASSPRGLFETTTPWEPWSQLTRELVQADVPVWAVGVGAPVAAVAACVKEGAHGVLDLWDLADALEKLDANLQSRRLSVATEGGRCDLHASRPGLPLPTTHSSI